MKSGTAAIQGGLSGASTGAKLGALAGSIVPGLGNGIGAGVGAAVGGALGAGAAALRARKQNKLTGETEGLLNDDLAAMKNGNLGMTPAEKRQALSLAMESAGQQAGQAQTQIARDSLGENGRDFGKYAAAQRGVGEGVANAGAQAAAQVNAASQQQAEARRAEILQRLQDQQLIDLKQADKQDQNTTDLAAQTAYVPELFKGYFPHLFTDIEPTAPPTAPATDADMAQRDARRKALVDALTAQEGV